MFPSAFLCRALGAALLLAVGATHATEAARVPPPGAAAAATAPGASAAGAPPAAAASVEGRPPAFTIPDLRQRIQERLAALRAARRAASGGERAASGAAQASSAADRPASIGVPPTGEDGASSATRSGGVAASAARAPSAASPVPRAAAPAASNAHAAQLAAATPPPASTAAAPRAAAAPAGRRAMGAALHAEPGWSYDGANGPAAWAALKPEYAACGAGRRQSPIDVRDGIAVDLEPLAFDYRPGAFSVLDNGHTVQVDVAPGSTLAVGGRRYELRQFHFHRPSEEQLEGRGYEMSVHLVHADAEGRLAVVAVLVEGGKAHPLVQQVWNNLPLERHEPQAAPGPIDPAALLPEDRRYATYMGSLTTPPCSEGVRWIVLKQPATMSPEQIAIFARLYPMNARPLQAASGRLVKASR